MIDSDIKEIIDKVIVPSGFTLIDIVDNTHEFSKDITKCNDIKISVQAKLLGPNSSIKTITFKIANVTPTYEGGLVGFNTRKTVSQKYQNIFMKNSKFQSNKHNLRPYDTTDKSLSDILIVLIKSRNKKKHGCFIFPKKILIDNKIVSQNFKNGKIAFRVWPSWVTPETDNNKKKLREWQLHYFIDLNTTNTNYIIDRAIKLLS